LLVLIDNVDAGSALNHDAALPLHRIRRATVLFKLASVRSCAAAQLGQNRVLSVSTAMCASAAPMASESAAARLTVKRKTVKRRW
jgi:hypothetical protein